MIGTASGEGRHSEVHGERLESVGRGEDQAPVVTRHGLVREAESSRDDPRQEMANDP